MNRNEQNDVSMTGHRIVDLGDATRRDEAATLGQVTDRIGIVHKGATVMSPQIGDTVTFLRAPSAMRVTRVSGVCLPEGSSVLSLWRRSVDRNDVGSPTVMTLLALPSAGNVITPGLELAKDEYLWFDLSEVDGGPTEVHFTLEHEPV